MTKREMNLQVFQGIKCPHVFFQPRMEPWFAWHKQFNTLPQEFKNSSLLDFYDRLDVSMRYIHYYSDIPDPVVKEYSPDVRILEEKKDDHLVITYHTPLGPLVEVQKWTVDQTWRTIDFPVKTLDDLKRLKWLCDNTRFHFNVKNFLQGMEFIGHRGEPQFWLPKSPYQALCQTWMKLENFIYALIDAPAEVEMVFQAIDASYDPLYQEIASSEQVRIINFGENIHVNLLSPDYFERYFIPFYQKRSTQLRQAGIYTHVHIDGYFNPLLKYLRTLPFDGYEALTPQPQGDVSLQEIKDHIGDKVLLDGIPAILFLSHHPMEDLQACVEQIVILFSPRLVLGISDELPEAADEKGIERVKWVVDYCRNR
jgi:hypothetical protein